MKTYFNHILLFFFATTILFSCREDLVTKTTTATLKGIVKTKETGVPLANAKITTAPITESVYTDAAGNFVINNIPLGDYSIKAELDGYVTKAQGISIKTANQEASIIIELVDDNTLNSSPSVPQLLNPTDNATNQPLTINFSWECSDPDTKDVLKYTLIIKNNKNNDVIEIKDITAKTYEVKNLKYGTTYFWQIIANDGVNNPVYSATNKFSTTDTPINRIHYVSSIDGKKYLVSNNLENNNLYAIAENIWRPRKNNNANLIAYLKNVGGDIHIFTSKLDGSSEFKVTSIPVAGFKAAELDFSWSQSGTEIIYANFDKLYRVNKDGTGTTLIYTAPSGQFITECDWSYNQANIAIKTNEINGYNANIYIIDMLGNIVKSVVTASNGALGGLNLSTDGKKLIYCKDISDYQDANYRQLDTRIFLYNLETDVISDLSDISKKPVGSNDLDPRFSPNDAEIIFTNTSNDGISQKNILKITLDFSLQYLQRTTLFSNAEMPDWE